MEEVLRRWEARRQLWAQAVQGVSLAGKSVLDAGTGEGHFTRFLAEQHPQTLVSLSCDPKDFQQAARALEQYADSVDFQTADLTDLRQFADGSFDFVGGDFLIAAVAGLTPFRECDAVSELVRVLKPGGRIVFTGWELGDGAQSRFTSTLVELLRLREAAHHLCGHVAFREHPHFWIERRLAELQAPAERVVTIPDVHRDFSWLTENVKKATARVEPAPLRKALQQRLDEVAAPLLSADLGDGVVFGQLYAVLACKLAGAILL